MAIVTAIKTEALDSSIGAAAEALFALQRSDGSWKGTLSPAATATGAAVIAMHLADSDGCADLIAGGVGWLRRAQGADGGWGEDVGSPSTPNSTSIAVAALGYAAPDQAAAEVAAGRAWLDAHGGIDRLADKSWCTLGPVVLQFLAYAGMYDDSKLSRIPVELALLPRGLTKKLTFTIPGAMSWGVWHARSRPAGRFRRLVGRIAVPRALAYLDMLAQFEGPDGCYEESPLVTADVLIGLHEAGVRLDLVRRCLNFLRATVRPDGSWWVNRDLEIPISGYVVAGLREAGYGEDERLQPALRWFLDRQRDTGLAATGCPPWGWGWAYPSGWPNTGDTTAAMLALGGFAAIAPNHLAIRRGAQWLLRMQNRDGSWGCFARNGRLELEPACSVMTADAVSTLLLVCGLPKEHRALRKAARWFERAQRQDGAFANRWYTGLTIGTANAVRALGELGLGDGVTARRCVKWLIENQNADGGWGEGEGDPSSAEETAWTIQGLLATGLSVDAEPIRRATACLLAAQRPNGLWDPVVRGIYYKDLLYASDHHANGHALQALSLVRRALR